MESIFDLTDIDFVDNDTEDIKTKVIESYESLAGKVLYPGDPVRLILETLCFIIVLQRAAIDMTAKQNLLRYATDKYLDHLGAFSKTDRLPETKAQTKLRFTISGEQGADIVIPKGTRATAGDDIYFETTQEVKIAAGETDVVADAQCNVWGEIGNYYDIGKIDKLVDVYPYYGSVTNITKASGGGDEETDDAYRERIHLAPAGYSVAGPIGAYAYYARSASKDIIDVSVTSNAPGIVNITLLINSDADADAVMEKVENICSSDETRPLTDRIEVQPARVVEYSIKLKYYISEANLASQREIMERVQTAIEQYKLWQSSKLGRDVNPSRLITEIIKAGASRVDIDEPEFLEIKKDEVARADTEKIDMTYGGLTDE